jgi:hypothetical protein
MYGFSDHSKAMPLTRFSAPRQGSSRYSGPIGPLYEQVFAREGENRLSLGAFARVSDGYAHRGWRVDVIPTRVGSCGASRP